MMELGGTRDDERWWSSTYSGNASQPNCIAGEALMVHFYYYSEANRMVELGLLKEFENIVIMELGEASPKTLWKATDFFLDLCVCMPLPAKVKLVLFETSFVSRHRLSMWFFCSLKLCCRNKKCK